MKEIALSKGYVSVVDDEDYARISSYKWSVSVGRTRSDGTKEAYALCSSLNHQKMHRFIASPPIGMDVDHINGDGLDNRRCNLRICSRSENLRNQRLQAGKSSVYKGVSAHSRAGYWTAQIKVRGKKIHLGVFKSETDAARAYDAAAMREFGEFAKTNFVEGIAL